MAVDHYALLGVPRDATTQDIKRAFRKIARECHPDVAGEDPVAVAKFQDARVAYEILMDPVTRARYDSRAQRRAAPQAGGSFFDAFYKRTGEVAAEKHQQNARSGARVKGGPSTSNMGLDDLLGGFSEGGRSKAPAPEGTSGVGPEPMAGRDLELELDVPEAIARRGGSVTATYVRMRRADLWQPGSSDPGLVRVEDLCEVRVLPGTRDGEILREHGMGDAGPWGGPAGDLLVRVRIVASVEPAPEPAAGPTPRPRSAAPEVPAEEVVRRVDISLVEAVLGGRVNVDTDQGPVRVTVPPGTSSHTRLRLRGKGPSGSDGAASDLLVEFRITVPRDADAESRRLIEEFGRREGG